jgi:hypothetical protein
MSAFTRVFDALWPRACVPTAVVEARAIVAVRVIAASVVAPLFTNSNSPPRVPETGATRGTLRNSFLSIHSHHSFFLSLAPREGRAERRWRLDACDAPRSARHDRRADAPSIGRPEQKSPSCVRCAPQVPRGRDRYAQTEPRSPICVETSCVTRRRARSPCGAPRGISGPGPCLPLSDARLSANHQNRSSLPPPRRPLGAAQHALQDRAPFAARVIVTRRSGSREPPRRGC